MHCIVEVSQHDFKQILKFCGVAILFHINFNCLN